MLGRNCRIGKNAQIHGSYLHDDVTIGDNAHVTSAMVCQGAVVHEDAGILPGAIISCKVRLPRPVAMQDHLPLSINTPVLYQ